MRVTVNQKDFSQEPVPGSIYQARFKKHKQTESEAGNPNLWLTFELLTQGSNPEIDTVGRTVTDNVTISKESMWRVNEVFEAATGESLIDKDWELEEFVEMYISNLQDKIFTLDVKVTTFKGKLRNSIESFGPPA